MSQVKLPSWRPGPTRETVEMFLDSAEMLPVDQRVAVFDIDGTLWCEKPQSPMLDFLRAELRLAVGERPELTERPEYRAALDWDRVPIARLGTVNVVLALEELHAGLTPEDYEARVRAAFAEARHPDREVPLSQMRYRPMLELIGELRARHFSVHVVTGSGTEFMRAVSYELFGVKPESVIGSQVGYELDRAEGVPRLVRTRERFGDPNDGPARIAGIQRVLGRRPILAAGDSAGDAEMLEYVAAFDGPSLALFVDHDDAEREYEYAGLVDIPKDWTTVSMRADWSAVWADS
jgi:phosphoserine phosphatase